jgi:hypothetical protein
MARTPVRADICVPMRVRAGSIAIDLAEEYRSIYPIKFPASFANPPILGFSVGHRIDVRLSAPFELKFNSVSTSKEQ